MPSTVQYLYASLTRLSKFHHVQCKTHPRNVREQSICCFDCAISQATSDPRMTGSVSLSPSSCTVCELIHFTRSCLPNMNCWLVKPWPAISSQLHQITVQCSTLPEEKMAQFMKLLEQIGEVHPGQTAFTWFMFSLWLLHSTRVTTCPFTNMSRFLTVPLPEVPMSGEGVVAIHVSRDYARTGPNRWRTGAFPKRRAKQPRKARVLLQRLIGSNLLLDVGQVLMSDTVRANKISQQRSVCCARAVLH